MDPSLNHRLNFARCLAMHEGCAAMQCAYLVACVVLVLGG